MNTYSPKSPCPRCGNTEATSYALLDENIRRNCVRCRWEWYEKSLDADKIEAENKARDEKYKNTPWWRKMLLTIGECLS